MVEALPDRARVVRHGDPAHPGTQLRPGRAGPRAGRRPGFGHRDRPGIASHPVPGPDRHPDVQRSTVDKGGAGPGRAGAVPGPAAGRRDAGGDRGGLHLGRCAAVPGPGRRAAHVVQLPGLGCAVQAHRGELLPAGRGVRRRPVPDPALAGPGPGHPAGQPAGPARRRPPEGQAPRPGRGAAPDRHCPRTVRCGQWGAGRGGAAVLGRPGAAATPSAHPDHRCGPDPASAPRPRRRARR